jgi:2-dehydro-3-deoxygluconokinase
VNHRVNVVSVGECMIELRALDATTMAMAFGGDTANVAIYLAHYGRPCGVDVNYLTLIGDDHYSRRMAEWLEQHGVSSKLAQMLPGGKLGLYLVDNSKDGERTFTYYREGSAARQLFGADSAGMARALEQADWVYLSSITIAVIGAPARSALLAALDVVRARGGRIAFDTNYRPILWRDRDTAREAVTEFLKRTDIALPTANDERALFGDNDEYTTALRLHDLGVSEVAVKLGHRGSLVAYDGMTHHIPAVNSGDVVDTTAAGDSFNAGYLFGRIRGDHPVEAARIATRVAGAVVCQPGAVIAARHLPVLDDAGAAR